MPPPRLSRSLTLLLAATTGLVAANLYYAQPLLATIGMEFGVREAAAGMVVTVAQFGYAAGLFLLVPVVLVGTSIALLAAAAAPSLAILTLALGAVGVTSVVVQIVVPLAAELATDDERGRVVGTVISGLLMGVLLSRTVAGLVSDA